MSSNRYAELDKLIQEYEEDFIPISSERLMMKNFPKVLTMSSASLFEFNIKNTCKEFLDNPKNPIDPSYPLIVRMLRKPKPVTDQMFAKLEAYDDNGIEHLDASPFYDLFGGPAFRALVESFFTTQLSQKTQDASTIINALLPLVDQGKKFETEYAKYIVLKDELDLCTFASAEMAYLSLKLRRNRVAHDYLHGLSDTFEDIRKFYTIAVIYVIALEEAIKDLTIT
jgi:hypothetical protein